MDGLRNAVGSHSCTEVGPDDEGAGCPSSVAVGKLSRCCCQVISVDIFRYRETGSKEEGRKRASVVESRFRNKFGGGLDGICYMGPLNRRAL